MGYLGRRIGKSQNQGDSNPSGADGAVGGGILDLFAHGYFERQGDIYNAPGSSTVPPGIQATGGVINDYTSRSDIYRAHIFTTSGAFNVTSLSTNPGLPDTVDYLVVGGGGGGGTGGGGGGGAGGFRTGADQSVAVAPYAVVVGSGGNGGIAVKYNQRNGNNSSIAFPSPIVSLGGGRGGNGANAPTPYEGTPGGSGGGHGMNANSSGNPDGGPDGQGNQGGDAAASGSMGAGGGGGASQAGEDGSTTPTDNAGDGGDGSPNVYAYGTSVVYAGGGGGGTNIVGQHGLGGSGGGGTAAINSSNVGDNGTFGTGGGGGGGWYNGNTNGGSGGSGVVVVRYKIGSIENQRASGGAISFYGGKTIHTFTSSGDFNIDNNGGNNLC